MEDAQESWFDDVLVGIRLDLITFTGGSKMRSRRILYGLTVAIVLLATSVLVACRPRTEPTALAPSPTPTEEEPTTLVVALPGGVESLDVRALWGMRTFPIARALYGNGMEWVLETDEAGRVYTTDEFRPGLLESWEVSEEEGGELVYTFHIRKGCKHSSGNELTSKDYKEQFAAKQALSEWDIVVWGCTKGADCIKILDDYTFEIHIDKPSAISDRGMEEMTMLIVDSEEVKKHYTDDDPWGEEWMRTNVAGCGAYRLDHITPGVEMLLVKNEDYCAPDFMQGYFDRVLIKTIPSLTDQMLLLKRGEVDIAPELGFKEALDLIGEPGVVVLDYPATNLLTLGFNLRPDEPVNEAVQNIKVRQALAYAVPYDDIIDAVYLGHARKSAGLIRPGSPGGTDKYWVYEYDLDKARELLAEAGYSEGFDLDIAFDLSRVVEEDAAVLIRDSFAKIGVNVNLLKKDPAVYQDELFGEADAAEAWVFSDGQSGTDDAGYEFDLEYSSWGFGNRMGYQNSELDEILKEAWTIRDDEVRLPMYDRANQIVDTEVPQIMICHPNNLLAMRDDLEGYFMAWDLYARYHKLYRIEK